MNHTVAVTKKGQMTLPKEIREIFGIRTPDRVILGVDKKNKAIKIKTPPDIMDLAGKYKVKKPVDPVKIREYMETHYERR